MYARNTLPLLFVIGFVSTLSVLSGAPPREEEKTTTTNRNQAGDQPTNRADQRTNWANNDQILASCVAIANQEEVAIARFAKDRSQNEDVKKFADMLVTDHSAFLQKLQSFAPEATRDGYLKMDRSVPANQDRTTSGIQIPANGQPVVVKNLKDSDRDRVQTRDTDRDGTIQQTAAKPNLSGQMATLNALDLHREMAQQCLTDSENMLSKREGDKFDACFVGMQIAKHAEMKTKLTVFQRHASGELADLFASASQTTEKHMKHAEELMNKIDQQIHQKTDSNSAKNTDSNKK